MVGNTTTSSSRNAPAALGKPLGFAAHKRTRPISFTQMPRLSSHSRTITDAVQLLASPLRMAQQKRPTCIFLLWAGTSDAMQRLDIWKSTAIGGFLCGVVWIIHPDRVQQVAVLVFVLARCKALLGAKHCTRPYLQQCEAPGQRESVYDSAIPLQGGQDLFGYPQIQKLGSFELLEPHLAKAITCTQLNTVAD